MVCVEGLVLSMFVVLWTNYKNYSDSSKVHTECIFEIFLCKIAGELYMAFQKQLSPRRLSTSPSLPSRRTLGPAHLEIPGSAQLNRGIVGAKTLVPASV